MVKPILVIIAGGLGSRYGGVKQMDPVDGAGHWLIDYSLYDARRAGFETAVLVVSPGIEDQMRAIMDARAGKRMELKYAVQRLDALPPGFAVPEGRKKPWGTAHAMLAARGSADSPFAIINADDFYGADAYAKIYGFLAHRAGAGRHAMVGYRLENTLTEHGSVSRAVCELRDGRLASITERTRIEPRPGGGAYTEDGEHFTFLPNGTVVSLNLWGFWPDIFDAAEMQFEDFLRRDMPLNPLGAEFYLPAVPGRLLAERKAEVEALRTDAQWLGVTHRDDMAHVRAAIENLKTNGIYPRQLWEV